MISMSGIGDHDHRNRRSACPESVITLHWNERSGWSGIRTTPVSAELQVQLPISEPRNPHSILVQSGSDEQGVVSALLVGHDDVFLGDAHFGRCLDEVAEEMTGLGGGVAVADCRSE